MKVERFVERTDYKQIMSSIGFSARKHTNLQMLLIYLFIAITITLILIILFTTSELMRIGYNDIIQAENIKIFLIFMKLIVLVFCAFGCYAVYQLRYLIIAAEFQNLLFSSAMKMNAKFAFIVNSNQQIVYRDENYSKIFAGMHQKGLREMNAFYAHEGISENDRERISKSIENGMAEKVPFDVEMDGEPTKLTLDIVPLLRPKGYFVIRAYDRV